MPSEMQERIARAIYEGRLGKAVSHEYWARKVKVFHELADEFPEYTLGGDGISDAFRDALAAMKAMLEPTADMEVAGTEAWLCESAMEDRTRSNWKAMLSHEIAAAEEAR